MASRIQGITVEIGGDATKLSKALESVNKSIKGTQSGLKDVNKLLKLFNNGLINGILIRNLFAGFCGRSTLDKTCDIMWSLFVSFRIQIFQKLFCALNLPVTDIPLVFHHFPRKRNNDFLGYKLYNAYKQLADKESKVIFGGRLGEYKYYDMDQVIAAALERSRLKFGMF